MSNRPVDLAAHLNQTVERGHPADFPVTLQPVFVRSNGSFAPVPKRLAVTRADSGETLAVVSDRYVLVPHQRILDLVGEATARLDVGPVPRGIYVDGKGARMRALFKFPALARPVANGDEICPCLRVQNAYDGRSRIAVHIGAFRFVCTNLAVGGGGAFAGGFMAVHAGEIPLEQVAEALSSYLAGFEEIVELYRSWMGQLWTAAGWEALRDQLAKRARQAIETELEKRRAQSVFEAYNVATRYATHEMRSYRTAFDLLERINRSFQEQFPLLTN
jgi:hypothetical protein